MDPPLECVGVIFASLHQVLFAVAELAERLKIIVVCCEIFGIAGLKIGDVLPDLCCGAHIADICKLLPQCLDLRVQAVDVRRGTGHFRLRIRVVRVGFQRGQLRAQLGFFPLQILELRVRRRLLLGKLGRTHAAVLLIHRQCLIIRVARLLNFAVFLGGGVARLDQALFVALLRLIQCILRGFQLIALAALKAEEHVVHLDLLPLLHKDAGDLMRLLDRHLVRLVRRHRARAADLCVDGAGLGALRRHLRQGVVHDRVREKCQHQQNHQKDDGGGLDPFSAFDFHFHSLHLLLSFHRAGVGNALHQIRLAV